MTIAQRLASVRQYMISHDLDYYLVPSTDAHNSEYVPSCWQRRSWISGFDGSAGEALIGREHALLTTDGRYFLQAEQQLDLTCFQLLKQTGFTPQTERWLQQHAAGCSVGVDPRLIGIERQRQLQQLLQQINGELVLIDANLIDLARLSLNESLSLPTAEAYLIEEKYSGQSIVTKLAAVRQALQQQNADYLALNVLDEIAWLFNLRGSDIEFNPLVISYALISQEHAVLFVDPAKLSTQVQASLTAAGVTIKDYVTFALELQRVTGSLWLDDKTASYWMQLQVEATTNLIYASSPVVLLKAIKNDVEISGAKQAHIKDAVAVINFMHWLEHNWRQGVDEISAALQLAQFRQQQANFKGCSFAAISGYAANGAVIHYHATPATNKKIGADSLYLIDSGGQYFEGTTDITRTLHLGSPTLKQKRHYTLVLKGHLALGRAIFSHGTCGEHLDSLARMPLWQHYLNYRHGTGHGVGSFLCVHEGPQRISPANSGVSLVPGMIVSNEPGLYLDGEYGIRIENLCLVTAVAAAKDSAYGPFYKFHDLTLVPYCQQLIELSLLTAEEIEQIQAYYQVIQAEVMPLLSEEVQQWLSNQLVLAAAADTQSS